jgi:hypothetical protein
MNDQRFEYIVHEVKNSLLKMGPDPVKLGEDLLRLGNQGWELATSINSPSGRVTLVFKRQR